MLSETTVIVYWRGYAHILPIRLQTVKCIHFSNAHCSPESGWGRQFPKMTFPKIRTRQDRTGQDRTGQNRAGQDRTGQDRTGQDRTGQDRAGQDRTGQDSTGHGHGQDRKGQDGNRWDRTGQDRRNPEIQKSRNPKIGKKHLLSKMGNLKCEKCHRGLEMVDLAHHFRVWCSPTSPELRVTVIGLIVLTKLHGVLTCVLLGLKMLLTLNLIVCTGKVGPTCCFGIKFVGFVIMP